jgi:hypothetical protein
MKTQKVERTGIGWRFWLWWIGASIAGSGAGVLLWVALGATLEAAGVDIDSPGSTLTTVFPGVVGAAFGTPFGIGQWLMLRRHLRRAGWWVLASSVGYGLVFLAGASLFAGANIVELGFAEQVLLGTGFGAAIGVPAAVLQWLLVLRGQVPQAGWWVLASIASWAVGSGLSFALRVALGGPFFVIGLVVPLALTGLAMVWLLRHPAPGKANVANVG